MCSMGDLYGNCIVRWYKEIVRVGECFRIRICQNEPGGPKGQCRLANSLHPAEQPGVVHAIRLVGIKDLLFSGGMPN